MKNLKIKLGQVLQEKGGAGKWSRLAKEIGISTAKLKMIEADQWRYITRDSIERVVDYFRLKVEDVFEFSDAMFWRSIQENKKCTFIRDNKQSQSGFQIPSYDNEAT